MQVMCAFIQALCTCGTTAHFVGDVFEAEWKSLQALQRQLPDGAMRLERAEPRAKTEGVLSQQGADKLQQMGCARYGEMWLADGLLALVTAWHRPHFVTKLQPAEAAAAAAATAATASTAGGKNKRSRDP